MPGEESETEDGRYPLPDYAAIDASGYDVNNKNIQPRGRGEIPMQVEADPDPDQVVVPDDCFGCGWLDKRVGTLHDRVDLEKKKFHFTVPRCFDKSPKYVPVDHPCELLQGFYTNHLQVRIFVESITCSLIALLSSYSI